MTQFVCFALYAERPVEVTRVCRFEDLIHDLEVQVRQTRDTSSPAADQSRQQDRLRADDDLKISEIPVAATRPQNS